MGVSEDGEEGEEEEEGADAGPDADAEGDLLLPLLPDTTLTPRNATPSALPFLQKETVLSPRSMPQVMTSPALQCSP